MYTFIERILQMTAKVLALLPIFISMPIKIFLMPIMMNNNYDYSTAEENKLNIQVIKPLFRY